MDEKDARGSVDVDVKARYIPAEKPIDGQQVSFEEVTDLLADEGVLLGSWPGGGGGTDVLRDPTTVATISIILLITERVVGRLVDGLLSALGEEAFTAAKRALKRVHHHQLRQLSGARTALDIEAPGTGSVSVNLPNPTTDEMWDALQNVLIPPFRPGEFSEYEIGWDVARQAWVLVLPENG
ncbi:MAG: hypothetical protein M3Z11_08275 [Candidatus Dormibacteraeota bacterium]|nr:hypothetical protein [Candidatus Dormibacteraeota bacterium]